ncbi:hypothetical protein ACH4ZX_33275 [Streptomyces sp. NPDC020490]|uniref:hypothetical protein n=1 Tax=Streptomyces sp. NPDC020490 TaxID=3365078 RepID=UPI0037AEA0C0
MEAVIAVFALLFVLLVVLGAYATVKAVGAAKRGVDRTLTQARRTVEDHALRAKSFAQPGPAGELAQLRLKLRASMRATRDALQAGVPEDASLKEALGLFERLSAYGHELDDELRRLESEPDRKRLVERLPALRERAERVIGSADSLRWAARDRARRFADDELDALSAQIDVEAGALRHWTEPEQTPASAPASRPRTPAADGPSARQTSAEPPAPAQAQESARPAITPPVRPPVHPWQKKARPETTT